jgi:hypothetical protein
MDAGELSPDAGIVAVDSIVLSWMNLGEVMTDPE